MGLKRRTLLQGLAAGAVSQVTGCHSDADVDIQLDENATLENGAGKLLILGGTGFVGPHVVRAAVGAGFDVTLFNRGRRVEDEFSDLELLVGDRADDLTEIERAIASGRRWQAVVDLSGFDSGHVRYSARLLDQAVDRYVFISSVAAYASFEQPNDESSPTHTSRRDEYGPQKARAEREAEDAMPGRVTNIRPTIIGGPGDNSDRLTYWPVRLERGGTMIAPGPRERPVQFIDVRDVAEFTIRCVTAPTVGTFNATIPSGSYKMGQLIADCETVTGGSADVVWITPEFADMNSLTTENGLPLWDSPAGDRRAFSLISADQAQQHGLSTRPPIETFRDTLEWWHSLPAGRQSSLRAGLSQEREQSLLAAWRSQEA